MKQGPSNTEQQKQEDGYKPGHKHDQEQNHEQDHEQGQASEQQSTPLLKISGLTIGFGQVSVLHHLDLIIQPGETLAIVGESGSGKSLTALSLLQLLPPHAKISGGILLDNTTQQGAPNTPQVQLKAKQQPSKGRQANADVSVSASTSTILNAGSIHSTLDLTRLDTRQMEKIRGAQIAMIFQEPMSSLNPVKTCGAQVAEAITAHHPLSAATAKAQVLRLFSEVQLPDPEKTFDKYPHQISGGQKQRVMIAMAMSCSPRLLICDEPTTALDVMVQKEILMLIKELQQKNNMSVLFISHDIQLVAEIADQIAVLYRGDLVEYGKANSILASPSHPYTRALLSCRPGLYDRGQRLPVVSDFLIEENSAPKTETAPESAPEPCPALHCAHPDFLSSGKDNQPILEMKDLNVWYPVKRDFWGNTTEYFKAVKKVNLEVFKGETLGLVGGSGCGKTTLGRAVMGLTPFHDGSIVFKGRPLLKNMTTHQRLATEMQMIFQDPYSALNPRITVGHAIGEALLVHGRKTGKDMGNKGLAAGWLSGKNANLRIKHKVCQWLERVGLQSAHYDRYPHEFSGGQRQRLVIARALILEPDFVICDESVSALDVSVQAQILNLFNDLKAELGFSSIFISHDLSVVRYVSDRIAVMNQGQLEELGPADEIYYHPESAYTRALLAAMPASAMPTGPK